MRARALLPLAILALTFAAVVRAGDPKYKARIAAFKKQAWEDRKAKGMDTESTKVFAAYPTPEVKLGTPAELCPGATLPLKLTGKFPEGTLFVVQSDDVEVKDEKVTATSWQAKVKVKPTATPHALAVLAIAPVSAAESAFVAANIGCKQLWTMNLDDGSQLVVKSAWPKGGVTPAEAHGEWKKDGKSLGKAGFEISLSEGRYAFEQTVTQADMIGRNKTPGGKAGKEVEKRQAAVMKKQQECMTKHRSDNSALMRCMTALQGEMSAVSHQQEQLLNESALSKLGCDQLRVEAVDGLLTGEARNCAAGVSHAITGTVKGDK